MIAPLFFTLVVMYLFWLLFHRVKRVKMATKTIENNWILFYDIESVATLQQPGNQGTEIVFNKKGDFSLKQFQLAGAVIRQLYCRLYEIDESLNVVTEKSSLLNIELPKKEDLTLEAIKYAKDHGFWELKDVITQEKAVKQFLDFLPNKGTVHFVAYNGNRFDNCLIELWLKRHNLTFPKDLKCKSFDPFFYLQGQYKGHPEMVGKGGKTLSNIYKVVLGKDLKKAHTAEADTKAVIDLLTKHNGDQSKMFKNVLAESKIWNPDISISFFGEKKLSSKGIKTLESLGWKTRAAIVYAVHNNGLELEKIENLSKEDVAILKQYCEERIKLIPKKDVTEPSNGKEEEAKDPVVKDEGDPNDYLLSETSGNGKIKVPGIGKGFIENFKKKNGRAPIVRDLRKICGEEQTLEKFKEEIHKISPSITGSLIQKTWNWLHQ